MAEKLTWDEIKKRYPDERYPDEWVILTDCDVNQTTDVTAGRVYDHGPDKNYIHDKLMDVQEDDTAILYTGRLQGGVARLGFARLEIEK
ncbi:MAG: hypothetical protein HY815_29500 [Candidatus Riflebacteria bacterium]|nr:hypothetical protein [Candidatus Riflebacteria bacterium]